MPREPIIHHWVHGIASRTFWKQVYPGDIVFVEAGTIFCNTFDGGQGGNRRALKKGEFMLCISTVIYPFPISDPGRLLQFISGRIGLIGIRASAV